MLVDHPVARAVVAARDGVRQVADPASCTVWQLGDRECLQVLTDIHRLEASLAAVKLRVLGAVDERDVTGNETGLGTAAWLHATCRQALPAARREVALARSMQHRFAGLASAMAHGDVSADQAFAVVDVLRDLPADLDTDHLTAAETTMVGFASDYGPRELRTLAGHLLEVIAPEIAEAAEGELLERQQRDARRTQYLRWRDDGDGTLQFTGRLPILDGEQFRTLVEAIARTPGSDEPEAEEPEPTWEGTRATALMTVVHGYLAGGTGPRHGGDRPRVTVVLDYDTLAAAVGAATLAGTGDRIPAGELRRLACDADILPAVLGSESQLLDLGHTTRLFTGDLRQAIALRDRGCVFPGCPRPPADCDAHHLIPWWAGGPTSLDNAALVCPSHHRLVEPDPPGTHTPEHERWHVRMSLDGIPEVIPPARRDALRQPQRHRRFRLRR